MRSSKTSSFGTCTHPPLPLSLQVREDAAPDGEGGGYGRVHEGLGGVLHEAVLGDLRQHLSHGGELLLIRVERHAVEAAVVFLERHVIARGGGCGGNLDADRGGDDGGAAALALLRGRSRNGDGAAAEGGARSRGDAAARGDARASRDARSETCWGWVDREKGGFFFRGSVTR